MCFVKTLLYLRQQIGKRRNNMEKIQPLLISLNQEPNMQVFKSLYTATHLRLFGVCLRILKNQQLAEDALQESFLKIWQKAAQFDPNKAGAMTWLSRIVRNQAIDMLRKQDKLVDHNVDPEEIPEMIDTSPGQVSQLETIEANAKLRSCLASLKAEQAHCLMSSYFDGQTAQQIADSMQRPVSTVKSWMARSMPLLRTCLEKRYESGH